MKLYFGSEKEYNNIIPYQKNHDKDRNYIIVSPSIIVSLINSIKFKHIPLMFIKIKNIFFCIEYTKGAIKKLKKSIYIYELNKGKIYKNDWNYFPDLEYEIHEEVKYVKKRKINNVYEILKKLNVIFIKNKNYEKFIDSNIPEEMMRMSPEEIKYFYHGSNIDIKNNFLVPHFDGFESLPYVYATNFRTAALKFSCFVPITWGVKKNFVYFLEIYSGQMNEYKKSGYLYYVKPDLFEKTKNDNFTFVSKKKVKIEKKEFIKNIYDEIKKSKNFIIIPFKKFKQFLLSFIY